MIWTYFFSIAAIVRFTFHWSHIPPFGWFFLDAKIKYFIRYIVIWKSSCCICFLPCSLFTTQFQNAIFHLIPLNFVFGTVTRSYRVHLISNYYVAYFSDLVKYITILDDNVNITFVTFKLLLNYMKKLYKQAVFEI